jgi:CRISPR-associated protein Cmr3
MTWFSLEPRDTLLIRDGRAMHGRVGRSLVLPHPPTLVGLLRTRLGTTPTSGFERGAVSALLRDVGCAGPLLGRLEGDRIAEVFAPAPADCLWKEGGRAQRLRAMSVSEIVNGARTDRGEGAWLPVAPLDPDPSKPIVGPRFWSWQRLLDWLASTEDWRFTPEQTGMGEFDFERRVHVSIDGSTGTAVEGELFATEGVRFTRRGPSPAGTHGRLTRWAILARASIAGDFRLERGLATLGGERSTAYLELHASLELPAPEPVRALRAGDRARVVLLTPAIFAEGALPERIAGARVLTGVVDRPQVVSGWNFAERRPRETRRMAAAGSVYWVEVPTDDWAERTWLATVSTSDQDRQDGFGLAVIGVAS